MNVSSLHVNTRTRFFCKKQKNSLIPASGPACQKEEIPPTVAQIAGKLDHSSAYLCDLIKSETGKDWKDYLSQKRLDIARSLLCQPEYSAATVAHLLGYADCQLFCRMFKQLTGNTPAEYNSLHLHTSSSYN